ncbi:MAG: NAD(P)-dependent glycerol-3-phosphate dehydrogenase, partial [Shewanellaceae bacterium]|nr:NAD(P)-dependent glycerol-3-phosphate dehydrogenase [Shewanellaceae bacterium]
ALLSGPTFAKELAQGLPTAIAVAATHADFAREMADLMHNGRNLRAYINEDFIGMQLGGAVKNVIAIAAGISDGLGYGANARTALITRGLNEMQRLGVALGAKPQTFMGMSGLGDLVLTCTDNQSRNRRYGFAIGQGIPMSEAQFVIGQVVEGHRNAQEVFALASRHAVEMPIVEQVYQVLYHSQPVREVARILLARARKSESF